MSNDSKLETSLSQIYQWGFAQTPIAIAPAAMAVAGGGVFGTATVSEVPYALGTEVRIRRGMTSRADRRRLGGCLRGVVVEVKEGVGPCRYRVRHKNSRTEWWQHQALERVHELEVLAEVADEEG